MAAGTGRRAATALRRVAVLAAAAAIAVTLTALRQVSALRSASVPTTTIGQLAPGTSPSAYCRSPSYDEVQPTVATGRGYVVPAGGVITSWSTNAAAGAGQQLELKVFRNVSGTTFAVVGVDGPHALVPGRIDTFSAHVPVAAGDVIGLQDRSGTAAPDACVFRAPGSDLERQGDLGVGASGAFTAYSGYRVNVTAVVSAAGPAPVLAQSVAAGAVSGTLLVKRPGTQTFVPLGTTTLIPVGSIVDATHGRVRLTSAAGDTTYTGEFYGGEFTVTQSRSGVTDLILTGGDPCAAAAGRASRSPVRKQSLWGTGHGHFQTSGSYASATELGTTWLTKDECTGTLIRVTHGAVRVHDFVTARTFLLRAPKRYFATS